METALDRAKSEVNGATVLAQRLSDAGFPITSQAISQWKRVPASKVIAVEAITGISRHELRPDVFGPAKQEGAAA